MGIGSREIVASPYAADWASHWLPHTKSVRILSDRLLLFFPAQTEIEAEHWFKRFGFPAFEVSDPR
jgi:hypothetical protein